MSCSSRRVRLRTSRGPADGLRRERERIKSSHDSTRPAGHAVLSCTFVSKTERTCNGTYVLPAGMLLTAGVLNTRLLYTAAIVGGTGLYNNARGTLTVTAKGLKPRREFLLFRLSG